MNDNTPLKKCTKCGIEKPATTEYFARARSESDGFQFKCKQCNAVYRKEHIREGKEYYQRNYAKNKERVRDYQLRNAERIAVTRRANYKRNAEEIRRKSRDYKDKNRDKIRQREIDYFRKNPHIKRTIDNRRRAKKINVDASLNTQQWIRCLEYFHHCCAVCGKPQGLWHIIAQDHWISISSGGATSATNIIPLCHAKKDGTDGCNNSKYNKHPEEWLISRFGKRKAKQILARIEAYFSWVKEQELKNV